jgi:hypothetical protein
LSEQNLLANTWVLIMADHGETIGEDGATWSHEVTVDEVMRPPLILAGPGIPEGKRVQALTESADIVPTLAELLRLPGPLVTEGKSLVPLLHGNTAPLHEYAFTRYVTQGYEGPTGYILRTPEYKYQYNDDTHEEFLWRVPDVVGKRSMCLAEHPGVAAEMRARMQRDLVPLWEAYAKLPKRYVDRIFTPAVIDACVRPRDAVIAGTGTVPAPAEVTDNKWTFREEGLWAAPWAEKAAPLEIRFEVPPGCYFVYVQVFGAHQLLEHRAGSIRIAVRGEPQPTVLQWMPEASKEQDSLFQEIGAYDLSGGVFDATVDSGDPEYWAAFGRFRFLMADKKDVETSSIAERKQREEQLRALGYAP